MNILKIIQIKGNRMKLSFFNRLLISALLIVSIVSCSSGDKTPGTNNIDSSAWTLMDSGTTENLAAIWGTSIDNIYAAGARGTLLHYNGSTWTPVNLATVAADTSFTDIWGISNSDIYVTGYNGAYHFDGNDWTEVSSSTKPDYTSVWLASPNSVYGIHLDVIYHSNDGFVANYTPVYDNSAGTNFSTQIRGSADNDIYVAGRPTLHFDGTDWAPVTMNGTDIVSDRVVVVSSNDVYLLSGGTVYHFNGVEWSALSLGTGDKIDIWADSLANIYVSGMVSLTQPGYFYYDGVSWTKIVDDTASGYRIYALWGYSGTEIFGVGAQGKIVQYHAP
jgi:hypothetical protein